MTNQMLERKQIRKQSQNTIYENFKLFSLVIRRLVQEKGIINKITFNQM